MPRIFTTMPRLFVSFLIGTTICACNQPVNQSSDNNNPLAPVSNQPCNPSPHNNHPSASPSTTSAPPGESVLFANVTRELGVDFIHEPGKGRSPYFMPRMVGSGAAFLDFDNDGRLDLYFLQN